MPRAITTKGTRKEFQIVIMILAWSLALPFALAQNDPGHDTLYIEQEGDSELTGSLNITGNLSIEGGRQALINYLDIYFNGQTIASPSVPTIAGTINDLYLDSKSGGNVYINAMASSGTVFLGSTGDTVNLNITGALYFNNDRLGVSAGGSAASGNLYWGDKLVCNTSISNCGWVSSATGGGDITAVNTNDDWLLGGAETGDVSLTFNESKLNGTIDARASGIGDGNNYTTAAGFVTSGSTETLQIAIVGRENVTASFTDTDTTYSNGTGLALSSTTFSIKACGNTEILKYNTSTSAWECKTDETGSGADGNNYTTAAGVTSSGLTKTIQIAILGRENVTASFIDNNTDTTYSNGTGLALSGTTFSLAAGVMTAGSYGNSTVVPVCTFDTYGRATSCTNTSINFPAGGNLSARGATAGYIPQFQNGSILNNSIISQSGNTLTINGNISMPANFYIGSGASATGDYSTAIGYQAQATTGYAYAIGWQAQADYVSTAVGTQASAAGSYATAIGYLANASGSNSTALGKGTVADWVSVAIGDASQAINSSTIAIGHQAQASGFVSTAVGSGASAKGGYATAIGYNSNTSGYQGLSLGYLTKASGQYSTAIGTQSNATADYATAIGYGVVNDITNSTKLGGMVILSGELNATSHNVTSVNCIVFDSGGKICTGG